MPASLYDNWKIRANENFLCCVNSRGNCHIHIMSSDVRVISLLPYLYFKHQRNNIIMHLPAVLYRQFGFQRELIRVIFALWSTRMYLYLQKRQVKNSMGMAMSDLIAKCILIFTLFSLYSARMVREFINFQIPLSCDLLNNFMLLSIET